MFLALSAPSVHRFVWVIELKTPSAALAKPYWLSSGLAESFPKLYVPCMLDRPSHSRLWYSMKPLFSVWVPWILVMFRFKLLVMLFCMNCGQLMPGGELATRLPHENCGTMVATPASESQYAGL